MDWCPIQGQWLSSVSIIKTIRMSTGLMCLMAQRKDLTLTYQIINVNVRIYKCWLEFTVGNNEYKTVLTHRSVQRNGGTWTLGTGHSRCRGGTGRSLVSGVGSVVAVDWTDWSPPGLPGHWSHSPHQNCNDNKIMLKLCNNKSHHIKTLTTINHIKTEKKTTKNVTMFMSKKSF